MMNATCEQNREQMVAFVRAQLPSLETQRLETHLSHCEGCADLRAELATAFAATDAWKPDLPAGRIDSLLPRLLPYMQRRETRSGIRLMWLAGPVAVAVGLVVALGTWWLAAPRTPVAPTPQVALAIAQPELQPVLPEQPASLLRSQPAPFVRLLAPSDWGGTVTRDGRSVSIDMQRGFVAAAFVGGRGRRLQITTPVASVLVVGTRFFVEVAADGATSVGVAEGRVRVRVGDTAYNVAAGEVRQVRADGSWIEAPSLLAAAQYVDDPTLVELKARAARAGSSGASDAVQTTPQPTSGAQVLLELEAAEAAVGGGRASEAADIYRRCAAGGASVYAPFRTLCALELGRLLGFQLDDAAGARRLLTQLRGGAEPEVRRQAELALCELDLKRAPCRAASCLSALSASDQPDATLRREAARLIARWNIDTQACGGAD